MSGKRENPFVGPRPLAYGEHLYGRERELARLRDLLISEQVVLLFSPSGAGKTSLIDAGLRPALEGARFTVLPTARVGKPPPNGADGATGLNRYVYSMLTDLEEASASRLPTEELSRLTLAEYLDRRAEGTKRDYVLILDQFEEVFTVEPLDRRGKESCFAQLGAAVEDEKHRLWLLLAMREEYLASLEPFCQAIPGYLNARFRLELLSAEQAWKAIMRSAADGGIAFSEQAVDVLVDDLCRVLVQEADGSLAEKRGQYVEPVHLQVACRRLLEHLPEGTTEISAADAHTQGNVDAALGAYYDECVAVAAQERGPGERAIRTWLDEKLITPQGMRGQVLKSAGRSEGMDNSVLEQLVDDHLIRAEQRRGLTWYELGHDRLIEPLRGSNRRWRDTHLQPWQHTAEEWAKARRPPANLLSGDALLSARAWAEGNPGAIAVLDREFLEASAEAEEARRAQVRQNRAVRGLSAILAGTILAVGGYYYSSWAELRPWGVLMNLSDGQVDLLRGNYTVVGRATGEFRPLVSLISPLISPAHLVIDRKRRVLDFGTENGSSRNGRFVGDEDPFGQELNDGDVLVLANIAPFKFRSVDQPWWQLWASPQPEPPTIPQDSWGLLIDGASRAVHYLVSDGYYVSLADGDRIVASETRTAESRLALRRRARQLDRDAFEIENLDGQHELFAVFKLGAYAYGACRIPIAKRFTEISFKQLDEERLCESIRSRAGDGETMRDEQPVENLIYYYLGKRTSFRVIPRIVGLEKQQ